METTHPLSSVSSPASRTSSGPAAPEHAGRVASSSDATTALPLPGLTTVDIDAEGVFKYVLLRVCCPHGAPVYVVRGHAWAGYHDDVFQHHRAIILKLPGAVPGAS